MGNERERGVSANGMVRLEFAGETNVGMKRTHNEDSFAIFAEQNLVIVADGMGGHASGEVASKMAVDALREFFDATSKDPDATWPYKMDKHRGYEENRLITGIKLANLRIYEAAQREPKYRGMGTTVVAVVGTREGIYIAHVGDSRVYRIRDHQIEQMTEDHSLLNDYLKMRRLTEEEIANFPHKNVIVRALGMKDTVKVDTRLEQPRVGDIYILCSDGLSGPVNDSEILRIVEESSHDLKTACSRLIAKANENGGPDNITACITRVVGIG
uniref:Phosphoprotein phosphatase n=1 Tax=uncultured delta proteobacterium TaxID=34034 RepID=H5SJE9_9DELT|nr:phosphoprotein phosphatase [uncultured delta proteobacterium]